MQITVNGETREVTDGLTVAQLLADLHFPLERVAVERNRQVLPREQWPHTRLESGDVLEIVQLVGGG